MNPAWLAALVALVGIVGGFVLWASRNTWRAFTKVNQFLEDWNGAPGDSRGHSSRPGVMERIAKQEELMTDVQAQVHTNGGESLKDAVNRTEAAADENGRKISELSDQMTNLHVAVEVLKARP